VAADQNTVNKAPVLNSDGKAVVRDKLQPDWWRKIFAGTVLGGATAYGLVGIFAWAGPGGISATDKVQFNMWMAALLWLLIFSFTFLFRSGNQALIWLGGCAVLSQLLLFVVRGALL